MLHNKPKKKDITNEPKQKEGELKKKDVTPIWHQLEANWHLRVR